VCDNELDKYVARRVVFEEKKIRVSSMPDSANVFSQNTSKFCSSLLKKYQDSISVKK